MSEKENTLLERIENFQDPIRECAGQPVIPEHNFEKLASEITGDDDTLIYTDVLDAIIVKSYSFVACGGNLGGKYAVLRKNPESGWQYIIDLFTSTECSE